MRGEEGLRWWFGLAVVGILAGKVPERHHTLPKSGALSALFIAQDHRFPARVAKLFSGSGFLGHQASCVSGVVEDQDATVAERDFDGSPGGALVKGLGLGADRVHSSLKLRMAGPFFADATNGRPIFR